MTNPTTGFSFDDYDLNFAAAKEANLSIYDAEAECKQILYPQFKDYVFVWEYGFYFLSLAIKHTNLNRSYGIIAAFHVEAMTSLRAAFLCNLNGYQNDSINTLRRVHDSAIRALFSRYQPQKMATIVNTSSLQGFHASLKMSFLNEQYRVLSSFTHANKMKAIKTWKEVNTGELEAMAYGCQTDAKMFSYSAKVSIFWLYFLIRVIPILFENQVNQYWLDRQKESLRMLYEYLIATKSTLAQSCEQLEASLQKLDFSIANKKSAK